MISQFPKSHEWKIISFRRFLFSSCFFCRISFYFSLCLLILISILHHVCLFWILGVFSFFKMFKIKIIFITLKRIYIYYIRQHVPYRQRVFLGIIKDEIFILILPYTILFIKFILWFLELTSSIYVNLWMKDILIVRYISLVNC